MFKKNMINSNIVLTYLLILISLKFIFCGLTTDIFNCNVSGSGNLNVYPSGLYVNGSGFITVSPGKNFFTYYVRYCKCYKDTGRCKIRVNASDGDKSVLILNIEPKKLKDIKNLKNKDVFKAVTYKPDMKDKQKGRQYCNVKVKYRISNKVKLGKQIYNVFGYGDYKQIVKEEVIFPFLGNFCGDYRASIQSTGEAKAFGNDCIEGHVSEYIISAVDVCENNKYKGFYTRSGYSPSKSSCDWGLDKQS